MLKLGTVTCHLAWRPHLLIISLLKIDMLKITVSLKNMKTPKMSGTARRSLPNIVCLKIGIAKNKICHMSMKMDSLI
jgi:hypothetical protein